MIKCCCIICRKPLKNGIIIGGRGICKSCEEKLTNANMDTDFYIYYKDCIKKNLGESIMREEDKDCMNYHWWTE